MVHRDGDGRTEVGLRVPGGRRRIRCRGQDRIQRDGEGLLRHPAFAELADQVLGLQHLAGGAKPEGGLQPGDNIGVGVLTLAQVAGAQLSEGVVRCLAQAVPGGQGMDDEAEDAGTLPGRGVPVGQ